MMLQEAGTAVMELASRLTFFWYFRSLLIFLEFDDVCWTCLKTLLKNSLFAYLLLPQCVALGCCMWPESFCLELALLLA